MRRPVREHGVAWLRSRPDMLDYGLMNMHVAKEVQARIVQAMKRDGILAPTTYAGDVQLRDWVIEALR